VGHAPRPEPRGPAPNQEQPKEYKDGDEQFVHAPVAYATIVRAVKHRSATAALRCDDGDFLSVLAGTRALYGLG